MLNLVAKGQEAVFEGEPDDGSAELSQNREDVGKKRCHRSGPNSCFNAKAGETMLASKLRSAKM